jgi:hypothetical protein
MRFLMNRRRLLQLQLNEGHLHHHRHLVHLNPHQLQLQDNQL